MTGERLTYAAAGVDIDAGERAVDLMRSRVAAATRPEVVGGLGGFAGLFALDLTKWRKPLLASSTDGVGTKLALASALDQHATVGIDLVAMVVDDLVVCGAEPLFLLDYIACGSVVPERIAEIVGGIADGCRRAGCALVGGETAEHPGLLEPHEYDLAATGVGAVEADAVLGPERVRAGDVVLGMASSGLHANGFSLVRHVLAATGTPLDARLPELAAPLGEVLLTPTTIYAPDCLAVAAAAGVHAFAHITGGGLAGNVARVLPANVDAVLDRSSWQPPAVFGVIQRLGDLDPGECERTFNQGVGMVAVVAPEVAADASALLYDRGVPTWRLGEIVAGTGRAVLVGEHPAA